MNTSMRRQYVDQLFEDNGVVELRLVGTPTLSGLYDDSDALLRDARQVWSHGHVYTSLNAPCPMVVSNRLGRNHGLKDSDIGWVTRLPFDFDPIRPAGVGSTEEEIDAAYETREALIGYLGSFGWPEPIRAFSGNGFHAQFRVRVPNNEETRDILYRIYAGLRQQFSTAHVQFAQVRQLRT